MQQDTDEQLTCLKEEGQVKINMMNSMM